MKNKIGLIWVNCALICILALFGCRQEGQSLVSQRKVEVRQMDSLALVKTQKEYREADSIVVFKEYEIEEMKRSFVFEKNTKYESEGHYVLPKYAGSKTFLSFFPEVSENGRVMLVFIDSHRKYAPVEIDVAQNNYISTFPSNIPSNAKKDVEICCRFARLMYEIKQGKKNCERLNTKILFYERKMEQQ